MLDHVGHEVETKAGSSGARSVADGRRLVVAETRIGCGYEQGEAAVTVRLAEPRRQLLGALGLGVAGGLVERCPRLRSLAPAVADGPAHRMLVLRWIQRLVQMVA